MSNLPTPSSFFSDTPPPRIIGTECEYHVQNKGNRPHFDVPIGRYVSPKALGAAGLVSYGGFLNNGGRLYIDVGEHPEYDTPECLGPRQAAAADIAGAYIMRTVVDSSKTPHRGLYRLAGSYMLQRNTDNTRTQTSNTKGYHENYLIPRRLEQDTTIDSVMPSFLATRLWAMSGTLRERFVFSQKVWGIGTTLVRGLGNRTTHGSKPMCNIPGASTDSDVIGNNRWGRFEVRFADPGLSPLVRYVGLAATSLVLRLVEHKDIVGEDLLRSVEFKEPVGMAKRFAEDLTLSLTGETVDGNDYTALDVQEILADTALMLSESKELPDDEIKAAELWYEIVEKMKRSNPAEVDYGDLIYMLDFAARHHYLSRTIAPPDQNFKNPVAIQKNLVWDRLTPDGGGLRWWQSFETDALTQEEIKLMQRAIPRTRAKRRAQMLHDNAGSIDRVNWALVKAVNKNPMKMKNPYQSESFILPRAE